LIPERDLIIMEEKTSKSLIQIKMKTATEMLNERLTIQDGHLKGARITISEALAKELMEEYHSQFRQEMEIPREEESDIFDSGNAA
jgi:hypothetical protein